MGKRVNDWWLIVADDNDAGSVGSLEVADNCRDPSSHGLCRRSEISHLANYRLGNREGRTFEFTGFYWKSMIRIRTRDRGRRFDHIQAGHFREWTYVDVTQIWIIDYLSPPRCVIARITQRSRHC